MNKYWKKDDNYYEYVGHSILSTYGRMPHVDDSDFRLLVAVAKFPHRRITYTIPEKIFMDLFEATSPETDEGLRKLLEEEWVEDADKFLNETFGHNPNHKVGTCQTCGKEMAHNVPRLGDGGGFIHKDSGKFECGYPEETLGSKSAAEIRAKLNSLPPEERERLYNEAMKTAKPEFPQNTFKKEGIWDWLG